MTLHETLLKATSEEDVKAAYIKALGLKNVRRNPRNVFMSTLDQPDVDVMKAAKTCRAATRFQYDYLNDDIADDGSIDYSLTDKMPKELRSLLLAAKVTKGAKKILVLMNPPYAEATNADNTAKGSKMENKTGVAKTRWAERGMARYLAERGWNLTQSRRAAENAELLSLRGEEEFRSSGDNSKKTPDLQDSKTPGSDSNNPENLPSPESLAVLEAGCGIWREYFRRFPSFDYSIREKLRLNRPDVGWYQIRQALKLYGETSEGRPTDFAPFEAAYAALATKLAPKVRELGFLR